MINPDQLIEIPISETPSLQFNEVIEEEALEEEEEKSRYVRSKALRKLDRIESDIINNKDLEE
jgi:uncharacterized protein YcbK (DUF882 family)